MKDKTGRKLNSAEVVSKIGIRLATIVSELAVYKLHLTGNIPFHH